MSTYHARAVHEGITYFNDDFCRAKVLPESNVLSSKSKHVSNTTVSNTWNASWNSYMIFQPKSCQYHVNNLLECVSLANQLMDWLRKRVRTLLIKSIISCCLTCQIALTHAIVIDYHLMGFHSEKHVFIVINIHCQSVGPGTTARLRQGWGLLKLRSSISP